jgi:alpha-tubulin suppressor-like RCC1 family protein
MNVFTVLRRARLVLGWCVSAVLLSACLSSAGPEAPTITEQPKDRITFIGQTAKFDFGGSGKPPFTFQWFRNGTAIAGATASTYTTPALTAADDGAKFSVTITNAAGTVTSSQATLTVKPGPSITTQPVSTSVTAGTAASFTVVGAGEQLAYQWFRDEVAISGATTATYSLTSPTAADDGAVFVVYVVNPGGFVASNPVTLTVSAAPAIVVQPVSQTVVAGDSLTLAVSATGGNLKYQWKRNGADIEGATSNVYRLAAAAAGDDNASFTVAVSNGLGAVTSSAAVVRVVAGAVSALPLAAAQVAVSKPGSASGSFTLVRRSNGTLASWGYNTDGQRGDGTVTLPSDTIGTVTLPTGRTARQIAVGGSHALVLLDNGDVYAWGLNDAGQLGQGDVATRAVPVKVTLPAAAIAIAAGRVHSVAVLSGGAVYTWGANTFGQLGDGGREAKASPVAVAGLDGVVGVAAGKDHTLALRSDGTVRAWGANASGQLGDGSFKPSRVPVVSALSGIARIRAGGDQSFAISTRRALYAWGENGDGQLGLGSAVDAGVPAGVLREVVDAATADRTSIALGGDGLARSAGANESGSLGDGGSTARNTFGAVAVLSTGISIDTGGRSFSAAIAADGTTYTWGDNTSKQLGNTTLSAVGTSTPTAVPSFDAIP